MKLEKAEEKLTINGIVYTLKECSGIINIYMDENERSIFIRDIYGNSDTIINAVTICNSGFLEIEQ